MLYIMPNPWFRHLNEFKAQHPGMTPKEAMIHAKETYTKVGSNRNIRGAGLGNVLKKAKKGASTGLAVAKVANKVYDNNSGTINALAGAENAQKLQQARSVSGKTVKTGDKVQSLTGGGFGSALKKAKKGASTGLAVAKVANKVYDNNSGAINALAGAENAQKLQQARSVSGKTVKTGDKVQKITGGKFNFRKALQTANKVGAVALPVASVFAPEVAVPLAGGLAVSNAIAGGSFRAPSHGGSFRAPSHGGSFRGASLKEADHIVNPSYSHLITSAHPAFLRPPPASLKNRPESLR